MSKVTVTFLIDTEKKRVVCAEAGSDFVDVLFSFLTLPLGRIVRLLGKQSGLGSLDCLYESVKQLDIKHLQTDACKEMLLNPRSAAEVTCEDLKVKNIFAGNPRMFYYCEEADSSSYNKRQIYHSHERTCRCPRCGELMKITCSYRKMISECGGIFVNETVNFLITDDLRVVPTSLMGGCSILKELQIKDSSVLEKKVLDLGTEETLNLLGKLLVSKNPLTEVCFPDTCLVSKNPLTEVCFLDSCMHCSSAIEHEVDLSVEENEITLNLILNTKTNSILYAEVETDFVNQLLSFLTFPLGSVLKLLPNISQLGGCINNLYSSVENMGLDRFKSENCRNMLLFPKLAAFYGIEKQILNIEEIIPKKLCTSDVCIKCSSDNPHSKHTYWQLEYTEQNPKSRKLMTDIGGAFAVESERFMIADNLHISPLSFISAILDEVNFPIFDLVEKVVRLDKAKTLSLLSTMLVSKTVFTDVFMCRTKAVQKETSYIYMD